MGYRLPGPAPLRPWPVPADPEQRLAAILGRVDNSWVIYGFWATQLQKQSLMLPVRIDEILCLGRAVCGWAPASPAHLAQELSTRPNTDGTRLGTPAVSPGRFRHLARYRHGP